MRRLRESLDWSTLVLVGRLVGIYIYIYIGNGMSWGSQLHTILLLINKKMENEKSCDYRRQRCGSCLWTFCVCWLVIYHARKIQGVEKWNARLSWVERVGKRRRRWHVFETLMSLHFVMRICAANACGTQRITVQASSYWLCACVTDSFTY